MMRNLALLLLYVFLSLNSLSTAASEINIYSPANGDRLFLNFPQILKFKVALDGEDSRIFIYVDGNKIQMLRPAITEYTFESISIGKHEICIKLAYKDYTLTGQQRCINVSVISPVHINYGN